MTKNYTHICSALLLCCMMLSTFSYALENNKTSLENLEVQKTIRGTVIASDSKTPLPGVTVLEKGTSNGNSTDFDGNYTLTVAEGATLIFSYVGFKTREVKVTDQETIDISLEPDLESLEETVVIGFNTNQKKSSLVNEKK